MPHWSLWAIARAKDRLLEDFEEGWHASAKGCPALIRCSWKTFDALTTYQTGSRPPIDLLLVDYLCLQTMYRIAADYSGELQRDGYLAAKLAEEITDRIETTLTNLELLL